jgi:hypothetical protein
VIRLLLFSLAIGAASTAAAQSGYTPASSFAPPHPAVVRVVSPERDGTAYGSGSLVAVTESTGLVVTNWHVVRDAAGTITVMFPDGFQSPAALLRTDRDWDLAALAIWRPNVAPIPVSNAAPRPGDVLTIAGYGSGSYRAVAGRCTQYVSPGNNQPFEMVELSAPARNGDSGGPILNDRGEMAGVLFGSAYGRTAGSYCGRLRWFMGTVDGDFRHVSSQAMLALQQQRRTPAPIAAIPAVPVAVPAAAPVSPPATEPVVAPVAAPIAGPVPRPTVPSDSQVAARQVAARSVPMAPVSTSATDLRIGQTLPSPVAALPPPPANLLPNSEQIKTLLAAIGIIAVLFQALRLLGWAIG